MLFDIFVGYLIGGIGCGLVCAVALFEDMQWNKWFNEESKRLTCDDVKQLLFVFFFTMLVWPAFIIFSIVWNIQDRNKKGGK